MESNISYDHIALEAMKIILDKTLSKGVNFFSLPKATDLTREQIATVAGMAYDFADAMVNERRFRKESPDE